MENQNSELKFEFGKKYKFADGRTEISYGGLTNKYHNDGVFTCNGVDNDGDCWSEDVEFDGESGVGRKSLGHPGCLGFCAATLGLLKLGEVVEVTP